MSEPVIAQKAPYSVEVKAGESYWWCSCGQSKNQPFCDGSHLQLIHATPQVRRPWWKLWA